MRSCDNFLRYLTLKTTFATLKITATIGAEGPPNTAAVREMAILWVETLDSNGTVGVWKDTQP